MQDNKLIKALVLNAQLGNNSAFEQLYQMTVSKIFILSLRITSNKVLAEHFTKKTYLNAWKSISLKSEDIAFLPWLKKITVETIFTSKDSSEEAAKIDKQNGEHLNEIEQNFFNGSSLERYISQMPTIEKSIYILHDIEHLSYREISKLLGISVEEVKTKLVQTREHLIKLTENDTRAN